MTKLSMDQIGRRIVRASKSLTAEQRGAITFDAVMAKLKTPVGGLEAK
jgi:hypothetical protein